MTIAFKTLLSRRLAQSLACLALATVAVTSSSCVKEKGPTIVKYVVPDGFRGVFQVTELAAPTETPPLTKFAENVITIPPTGLVHMSDTGMYMVAHQVKCVTTSATAIPYARPDSSVKGVNIFPLYTKSGEDQYYLVGTSEERDHIWANGKSFIKLARQVLPDPPAEGSLPPEDGQ